MDKWYMLNNQDDDIVISTRIRLARNAKAFPFKSKITKQQQQQLNEKIKSCLEKVNFGDNSLEFINISELSQVQRLSLVEKHIISHNFANESDEKLLVLSKDNSISIMVNEEDHLRIQVLSSGLNLSAAYEICSKIDDALQNDIDFSFDPQLGYLTSCPTNLGTGLRASVMLHLPAIEKTNALSQLISTVNKLGLTIRGTYGEGTQAIGSVYQLSNQVTLGIDEKTALDNLESIVCQILQSEKMARETILKNNINIADEIFRSLGALKYARLLSSTEFFNHISNIRLGLSQGLITDIKISTLNLLINICGSASICEAFNKSMQPQERDYYRAKIVREKLL